MVRAPGRRTHRRLSRTVYLWRRVAVGCLVATLAAGLADATAHAAAPRDSGREVVVQQGQGLWALAARYAPPGSDPRVWIFNVEALNGLAGAQVAAGEVLRLPG